MGEMVQVRRPADPITEDYSLDLDRSVANRLDLEDPLKSFRAKFHIPKAANGKDSIYLCGNSLGLQPRATSDYIFEELKKWEVYGVEGHFTGKHPWVSYDGLCLQEMADVVGAKAIEVVLMNTLTVNLHLMLTTFYRPTEGRYKILVEEGAFPSDIIALTSQVKLHGYDPSSAILLVKPRPGQELMDEEELYDTIREHGKEIALIFLGGVNYYTGQVLDIQKISQLGREEGCVVGFDLAHAVGNVDLQLNKWMPDFAVWCTYKYLNSGPGGIGGCFVHEKHALDLNLPRLSGWWSHQKETRFQMKPNLILDTGASGFQLSNPSILCLAALRASLALYSELGMPAFVRKSRLLTGYLATLLEKISGSGQRLRVISPSDPEKRGCQLSIIFPSDGKTILERLQQEAGVIADFRQPNCIRIAPNPFYNSYTDILRFVEALNNILN